MKSKYLNLSILLNSISIITTLVINYQIAVAYMHADGKTRLWFFITEFIQFEYQFYVVVIGVVAFILALLGKSGKKRKKLFAILFSLFAILLVFLRIWRIYVW